MALPRVKFCSAYINGKKIAELENNSLDIMTNAEALFGSDGWLTMSDGALQGKATFDTLIPTSGTTPAMLTLLLGRDDVDFGMPIDGKFVKAKGRFTGVSYKSDSKTGKTNGSWTLEFGQPAAA